MGATRIAMVGLLLAACGSSSKDDGPAEASPDVTGTLTIDGAPRRIVACQPKQELGETVLVLRLERGALMLDDDDAYYDPTGKAMRGDRYGCATKVSELMSGGDSVTGKAFMHGTLRFECARGKSTIAGELTLACGELDDATRARLEGSLQEARELVPATGDAP